MKQFISLPWLVSVRPLVKAVDTTGLQFIAVVCGDGYVSFDFSCALSWFSVVARYSAGENICKQGTFASHIMVLNEGLAKIYKEGGNDTLILKILPAVNIIGLNTLFDGNNVFQYSAMAYLSSKVQMIEMNAFKQLINTNAKFAAKIISMLSRNCVLC